MHHFDSAGWVKLVLSRFASVGEPQSVESLGSAGGLSGAEFWRLSARDHLYCLRRWPRESPSEGRLPAIHRVLHRVFARGVVEVAVPLADSSGNSIVRADGSLWELSRWLPGSADYARNPNPERLQAAMQVLARFHLAAPETASPSWGPPPGLQNRQVQLQALIADGYSQLRQAKYAMRCVDSGHPIESFSELLFEAFPELGPRVLQLLVGACCLSVERQPCIRDVWHDHVLFSGQTVTGLVDFGAMQDDNVASDVSRLLGSLVQDDVTGWQVGLNAYEHVRPLSPAEHKLVRVYDASGVLLSATNWLRWLYVDGRSFDAIDTVRRRCDVIASRLNQLNRRLCRLDM